MPVSINIATMLPASPQSEYLKQRVTTASPVELILILYQTAVETVDQALAALRSGDILRRGQLVGKAVDILSELRLSLRREVDPAYCDTLTGLYGYLQRQLLRAHGERSEIYFQEVARLLRTLLEGWAGAMRNLGSGLDDARPAEQSPAERADPAPAVSPLPPYSEEPARASSPSRSWQL